MGNPASRSRTCQQFEGGRIEWPLATPLYHTPGHRLPSTSTERLHHLPPAIYGRANSWHLLAGVCTIAEPPLT